MKNLKLKKSLSLLLSFIMIITTCAISFGVSAEDETSTYAGLTATASGDCTGSYEYDDVEDDSVKWAYYADIQTLVISGTGAMVNFTRNPDDTSIFGYDRGWFDYINEIETVIVEEGVTVTGTYAFRDCTAMTSISYPDTLVYVGSHTTYGCTSLEYLVFPESVTTLGTGMFYNCYSLLAIYIPASVTEIGNTSFYGGFLTSTIILYGGDWNTISIVGNYNTALPTTSVSYFNLNTEYEIDGCDITWSLSEDFTLTISGEGDMPDNTDTNGDGSIGGPDSPWYDLLGCLKALVIEEGITSIGAHNFQGTASYSTLSLPTTLVTIGDFAFQAVKANLTSLNIPEGVTSIGEYAFRYSNALNTIYLPSTLESIGDYALDASNYTYTDTTLYYAGTETELAALTSGKTDAIEPQLTNYVYNHVCSGSYASTLSSPTCTETGIDLYACSTCGTNYQVVVAIDSNAHTYDSGTVTAPTCTAQGYTTYECVECTYSYVDADSYVDETGHSYEAEDYTAPTDTTLDSYTAPTYTVDGYWTVECTNEECTVTKDFTNSGSATAHATADLDEAKSAIEALTFTTDEADMKSQIDTIVAEYTDGMSAAVETVIDPAATTMADGIMTYTVTLTAGTQTATVEKTATVDEIAVTQDQLDAVAADIETALAEVTYADGVDSTIKAAADSVIETSIDSTITYTYAEETTAAKCEEAGSYAYTIELSVDDVTATVTGTLTITATGHTYSETANSNSYAATCIETGMNYYSCTVEGCTSVKEEIIPIDSENHDDEEITTKTVEPTCTLNGYTYSYYACCATAEAIAAADLDAYNAAQADGAVVTDELKATGHDWSKEDGICAICLTSCSHEDSVDENTCSICGTDISCKHENIADDAEWVIVSDATCSATGTKSTTCLDCNKTVYATIEIDSYAHSFTTYTTTTAANCTYTGIETSYCDYCKTATDTKVIAIDTEAHVWNDYYTVDTPATCGTAGSESIHCSLCDATTDSQPIAATGHSFDATDYVAPTDTTASNYTPATTEADGYWTVTCTADDCNVEKIIYNEGSKEEPEVEIDYAAELAAAVEAVDAYDFELTTDLTEDTVEAAIIAELEAIVGEYVTVSLTNVEFTPAVEAQDATDDTPAVEAVPASVTFDVVLSAQDQENETITFTEVTLETEPEAEVESHLQECKWYCSCICAKSGVFYTILAKICIFFWELFGINQYCSTTGCGGVHY